MYNIIVICEDAKVMIARQRVQYIYILYSDNSG